MQTFRGRWATFIIKNGYVQVWAVCMILLSAIILFKDKLNYPELDWCLGFGVLLLTILVITFKAVQYWNEFKSGKR